MTPISSEAEVLRNILENSKNPEMLDSHPWVSRLFVKDVIQRNQDLQKERPAQQLMAALGELFLKTMPSTPPRRGKRLDTHWAEFGILAALYFAPLEFGAPSPISFRDAWGRMDQAILLYVAGRDKNTLSKNEIESYKLVGDEPEVAAISTLSDWHCKGLQRLADTILAREQYLGKSSAGYSSQEQFAIAPVKPRRLIEKSPLPFKRAFLFALTLIMFVALACSGYKAWRIYPLATAVLDDMSQLRARSTSSLDLKMLMESGALLSKSKQDLDVFSHEVDPVLWMGPWLKVGARVWRGSGIRP